VSSAVLIIEKDNEILEEFSEGNSELAATSFVRKYQNFVFSIALRYLQSFDDAEDAAQEAFIKALKGLKKFKGNSSLKTWLYRITINVCNNMMRKKKVMSFFRSSSGDEDYFDIADSALNPEENIESREFEDRFMKALNKLPEKQRETFALRYFDELTYEEISKMIGTSVGGLKANYYQATKKLAQYLEKN
jgi:RNA polymerase sigma factor (sigma-70 family)